MKCGRILDMIKYLEYEIYGSKVLDYQTLNKTNSALKMIETETERDYLLQ